MIARGTWQRDIWWHLTAGRPVVSPPSRVVGRAKRYQAHYRRSFVSLLDRARAAGFTIERTPGVRGGEWSATYRLRIDPLVLQSTIAVLRIDSPDLQEGEAVILARRRLTDIP